MCGRVQACARVCRPARVPAGFLPQPAGKEQALNKRVDLKISHFLSIEAPAASGIVVEASLAPAVSSCSIRINQTL